MLWFNAAKDLGALQTAEGERIEVSGDAFAPNEKPKKHCQTFSNLVTGNFLYNKSLTFHQSPEY